MATLDFDKEQEFARLRFSSILSSAMAESKVTKKDLSIKTGLSIKKINIILTGKGNPALSEMTKLILATGYRMDLNLEFLSNVEDDDLEDEEDDE
jgi:transcriptional regulator with XRE-family HTH domain